MDKDCFLTYMYSKKVLGMNKNVFYIFFAKGDYQGFLRYFTKATTSKIADKSAD